MRFIEDFSPVESLTMCPGVGDFEKTACVVAQAAILDALHRGVSLTEPTDELDCACPLLRHLAIGLNDTRWWDSDAERSETLRPLVGALLDSRVGPLAISKRASLASGFAAYAAGDAAGDAAEYAAMYAAKSAKSAKSAAEYAKSAAVYEVHAAVLKALRTKMLECFWACEAIKDEPNA